MSLGIVEVITLLMALSGLSIQPNPRAPTAEQALEYAVADADVVVHFDAASVFPGNYRILTGLPNQPQIKASPQLSRAVRKAVAEIDGPRALVKNMVGVDITTDVSDATAFVRVVPAQEPQLVVAARGKFKGDVIDKIAKVTGKTAVKSASSAWVDTGDGNAVGLTKTGVLLVGTSSLVLERLAPAWKKPSLAPNTNLGHIAEVIDSKPVFAVAVSLSKASRSHMLTKLAQQSFATDMIKRHKLAAFAVYRDGIGWKWIDSSRNGLENMTQFSEGAIELLRAAQVAPRGVAKIVLASLESYRGTHKELDAALARKADIQKLVTAFSGDGTFKAQVDKDPATLKLSVRLTGKSLSEVLPAGALIPLGFIGMYSSWREDSSVAPPPPGSRPAFPPIKGPAPKRP